MGIHEAGAQDARFFRLTGPAPVGIVAFHPDGTLVWTNAQPGTNYILQTAVGLPGGTNWVTYAQLPGLQAVNTNQIAAFHIPAGMAFIPDGVYTIGDTLDGESDALPTNVYVSAFFMDTTLVTYGQWQWVYNWATNNGYVFDYPGAGNASNQPVNALPWSDCVKWCNARSQLEGLTPVYYTNAAFTVPYTYGTMPLVVDGTGLTVYANWSANGYRLPTEAEWEKAARGGLMGQRFPWGLTITESQANYHSDIGLPPPAPSYDLGPYLGFNTNFDTGSEPYTSPVGYFPPNGYGLYDMAGNLTEWCWGVYSAPPYPAGSPYLGGDNPADPMENGNDEQVIRGGGWDVNASGCRCAYREFNPPGAVQAGVTGFRCARAFKTTSN